MSLDIAKCPLRAQSALAENRLSKGIWHTVGPQAAKTGWQEAGGEGEGTLLTRCPAASARLSLTLDGWVRHSPSAEPNLCAGAEGGSAGKVKRTGHRCTGGGSLGTGMAGERGHVSPPEAERGGWGQGHIAL